MGDPTGNGQSSSVRANGSAAFFNQFVEACLMVDADSKIIHVNNAAEAYLRTAKAELIGQPLASLFASASGELGKLSPSSSSWIELSFGTFDPCKCLWLPLPSTSNQPGCAAILFSQCTPGATTADRELEQARKSQEEFIYSVSHDLRAPLRAIQGFSNLLRQELGETCSEMADTYIKRTISAADRMELFLNDLLILSRIARAESMLRPIPLPLIFDAVKRDLSGLISQKQGSIEIEGELPQVAGTTALCQYVFHQLFHNSLTYVAEGVVPRLVISAEEGEELIITVSDNGLGIKPEHHEKIFKQFERLHSADRYPGTGLGLTIVERAMQKLGGRVEVQSELGQGAKFLLHFRKPSSLKV